MEGSAWFMSACRRALWVGRTCRHDAEVLDEHGVVERRHEILYAVRLCVSEQKDLSEHDIVPAAGGGDVVIVSGALLLEGYRMRRITGVRTLGS